MSLVAHVPIKNSIATRILFVVLGLYLLIALGVALCQVWIDYGYQKANHMRDLKGIGSAFEEGLAVNLWVLEPIALKASLDGMLEIPVVLGVTIKNPDGIMIALGGTITQDGETGTADVYVNLSGLSKEETTVDANELFNFELFEYPFAINYEHDGETIGLGEATLYSSNALILDSMKVRLLMMGVSVALTFVTFFLALLWAFNRYLRRPLGILTSATAGISLDNLGAFSVDTKTSGRNEIKVLEESFSAMIGSLHRSIVKREDAEAAMRESEEHLRSLVGNIPGLSYRSLCDENWTMKFISDAVEPLTGYPASDFIGNRVRTYASVIHPDDRQGVNDATQKSLALREPFSFEYRVVRADGGVRWVYERGRGVFSEEGEVRYLDGVIVDTTERRELETQLRQAQKMEAVGQLAGGIAHDFNNLLQVIDGYTRMAMEEITADSPIHENLTEVMRAADRATSLVGQLLAFSRQQVLEMKNVDLNNVVNDVMKLLRRVIGEHVSLDIHKGQDLGMVLADSGQIEQILMNLCVNARDAMPGGGRITIETENIRIDEEYCTTHTWAKEGWYVVLSVTDTGSGMDDETLGKIFEPFFTTKEFGQGTGLGLATVYGLVKQHNGMIHAYSEIGIGTVFKVYLPLVADGHASVAEERVEVPVLGGTETILVGEDDEMVRKLTRTTLEAAGYTVLSACDGEEALEVFGAHMNEIDLVLLDVVMPKLGGRVVYERIREQRPGLRVLFASGYSMNAVHTSFVLDEGLHLIQKPFQRDDLLRKVREVLGDGAQDGAGASG